MNGSLEKKTFFSPPWFWVSMVVLLLAAGLGIRMVDLTEPPLDFHPTRQLRAAIIARGMYYESRSDVPAWQKERAVKLWQENPMIEPPVFEWLVAETYRLAGKEILWVARVYAALFWLIGGVALFFLAKEMTSVDGAIVALALYLFWHFSIMASRSFQPDPLMVMWIVLAWQRFYHWSHTHRWRDAVLAGLFAGMAILIKSVAVFMLAGGMGALVIFDEGMGLRKALKDKQVWTIAVLSALPAGLYMIAGIFVFGLGSQFEGRFFPEMLRSPGFYLRWLFIVKDLLGGTLLVAGLLGLFLLARKKDRAFLLGLWGGYILFGLMFPYHYLTHSYYHLPLMPLAALSVAPIGASVFSRLAALNRSWLSRWGIVVVFLLGIAIRGWGARLDLVQKDFRGNPGYWADIAKIVGVEHPVVALSQDYGYRLAYYGWLDVTDWPDSKMLTYRDLRGGRQKNAREWFDELTKDKDYFIVTRLKELSRQQDLKKLLSDNYPVVAKGDGYLIYDLKEHLP